MSSFGTWLYYNNYIFDFTFYSTILAGVFVSSLQILSVLILVGVLKLLTSLFCLNEQHPANEQLLHTILQTLINLYATLFPCQCLIFKYIDVIELQNRTPTQLPSSMSQIILYIIENIKNTITGVIFDKCMEVFTKECSTAHDLIHHTGIIFC